MLIFALPPLVIFAMHFFDFSLMPDAATSLRRYAYFSAYDAIVGSLLRRRYAASAAFAPLIRYQRAATLPLPILPPPAAPLLDKPLLDAMLLPRADMMMPRLLLLLLRC